MLVYIYCLFIVLIVYSFRRYIRSSSYRLRHSLRHCLWWYYWMHQTRFQDKTESLLLWRSCVRRNVAMVVAFPSSQGLLNTRCFGKCISAIHLTWMFLLTSQFGLLKWIQFQSLVDPATQSSVAKMKGIPDTWWRDDHFPKRCTKKTIMWAVVVCIG
jgi:hypothetical protein